MKNQRVKLKLYTSIIILIGIIFVMVGFFDITSERYLEVLFFILIGTITQSLQIRVKNNTAFSITYTIGLATVFIFQPYIVAGIGFMAMLLYFERHEGKAYHLLNTDIYKRVFNASSYAIALTLSSIAYNIIDTQIAGMRMLNFSILGILVSILTYTIVNPLIFIMLMCMIENKKFKEALKEKVWAIINIVALSPLGVVTAIAYTQYGWFAVALFLGPLLVARYSFKLYIDMKNIYFETIKALSNAVEAKDEYTNGHSYRVANYAIGIAREMGMREEKIEKINTAAILHDIGKIGISDVILNKPDRLEEEEFLKVQMHPEIGAKILHEVDFLKHAASIVMHHHEFYNGKGYPTGLKGDDILLESCVLSVADAYDAMTSDRAYRKALDPLAAQNIIIRESGNQFHPKVVEGFKRYIEKLEKEEAKEEVKEEIIEREQMPNVS